MRFQAEPLLFALATTAGAWPTLTSPSSLNLHIRIPGLSSFFNKLTHRQDTSNSIILLPGEAGYTTDTIATPTPSTNSAPLPTNNPLAYYGVSKDGTCGNGYTCIGSGFGDCCSAYSFCGSAADYCTNSQCDWGACIPPDPTAIATTTSRVRGGAGAAATCAVQLLVPSFCGVVPYFDDKASCDDAVTSCSAQAASCASAVAEEVSLENQVDVGAPDACVRFGGVCRDLGNVCAAFQ